MRIPSGVTDQYIYFVAVDATDLKTRETGLNTWTVYRSRNGAAAASFTTPTINETDSTNMPGVYELLLDEDMTIDAGDQSQEMVVHITHAGMAPVTRVFELYRPSVTAGTTIAVTAGAVDTVTDVTNQVTAAAMADAVWDEAATGHTDAGKAGEQLWTDVDAILVDTGTTLQAEVDGIQADTEDIQTKIGTPAGVSVSADIAAVKTDTAAILVDTGTTLQAEVDGIQADTEDIQARIPAALVGGRIDASVGATAAGAIAAGDIAAAALNEIADAILDRVMSAGTDSGADNASSRTVRQALRALRNKTSIAGGTLTVTKEDDTTASWTSAISTAAGNPISASDPT